MRNITGSPAEGEDFYNRHTELQQFMNKLENDSNILLTAPRRVGKTSLALKLCERYKTDIGLAIFFNVESCSDELGFAEMLIRALKKEEIELNLVNKAQAWLATARNNVKSAGGTLFSIRFKPNEHSLDDQVRSLFEQPKKEGWKLLIVVDELPVMLHNLLKKENGEERVREFLHWLRTLRQEFSGAVQWILLGSIGLNTFTESRNLGATINDMNPISIGAFLERDAHAFLEKLGMDNSLPLSFEARKRILEIIGWGLPYHLQLMFHALKELGGEATLENIETAFKSLVDPSKSIHFDTWRQRLSEQLPQEMH